ncbi:threonylcarbamoyl-AMP synthase [Acidimicrobium ferrooxidans]|uniref:Threonylcarbamoyl-AMP synthase n=1 Tax=Acidimicrobium ferrooxidans TaxID=53635 RepID=A0ABS3ATU4_9ACTN|nr:threonylcarbamoyl-AMP synthase [Acidimicrobium ferrooxidans]
MQYIRVASTDIANTVEPAAALLRNGGIVAFPTETVYGLGADAFNKTAVRRIFAAKGRPPDDPLIVHIRRHWHLDQVFAHTTSLERQLLDKFWPGPLTLIGPKATAIPSIVTAGLADVAVRAPSHPVAIALLDAVAGPVAAPSANRFSYVSATTAQHVVDDLGDSIDAIVDAGPSTAGIESTVVRLRGSVLEVLRHGATTIDAITTAMPDISDVVEITGSTTASPGQLLTHYSPNTATIALAPGSAIDRLELEGSVVLVGYDESVWPETHRFVSLGSRSNLDGVARTLYETLRTVDSSNADTILIELTGASGIGRALDDRIRRAASGRVEG